MRCLAWHIIFIEQGNQMSDKPTLRVVQLSATDRQDIVDGLDTLDASIVEARSVMLRRNAEALAIDQFTAVLERLQVLRRRLQ